MAMNFKEFLNEAVDPVLDTKEKIETYIESKKKRFEGCIVAIDDDLTVNVKPPAGSSTCTVDLSGLKFSKIPLKFGKIEGSLNLSNTNITTFENAPRSSRAVIARNCKQLVSLKGVQENINQLDVSGSTALKSLEGVPRIVRFLSIENCTGIESLHNIHEMAGTISNFYLDGTDFKHSILGLALLKNCQMWKRWSEEKTVSDRALNILNRIMRGDNPDIFDVQAALVNAGLGRYAEL
ncbi:hypothetical protein RsoM2USA_61 [Ralstonia phage RsoM2USA]|nr:hypothetical protein RsoM2USA_61 [Ralstonia phage RsoM2USA]